MALGDSTVRRNGLLLACRVCGVGLLSVWVFLRNSSGYPTPAWPVWVQGYGASSLALLIACAVCAGRSGTRLENCPLLARAVLAAVLGSGGAALLLGWTDAPLPVAVACFVATDACTGWFTVRWVIDIAGLRTRDCVAVVVAAFTLYTVSKIVMPFWSQSVRDVLAVAFPPCIAALLVVAARAGIPEGPRPVVLYRRGETLYSLWPICACMAVFVVVYSLIDAMLTAQYGSFTFGDAVNGAVAAFSRVLTLAVWAAVAWWVFVHRGSFTFVWIWRVLATIGVAMLLSILVLGNSLAVKVLVSPANMLGKAFMLMMLADAVRHSDAHPVFVASAGLLTYTVAKYTGHLLVASGVVAGGLTVELALGLMGALALASALFATSQRASIRNMFSELNIAPAFPDSVKGIDFRCAELSHAYGLSEREAEVLALVAKGRSKPYIAEELFISENTVRTYVKRIYGKLDVHNKIELQELVDDGVRGA